MNRSKIEFRVKSAPLLGLTDDDACTLLRKAQTLQTWAEHECNGTKQREERHVEDASYPTGGYWEPTGRVHWYNPNTGNKCGITPDLETGALKSVAALCARAGLSFAHQGDPRGYVLRIIKDGREFGVPTN